MDRRLIVNADDFGQSDAVNAGIRQATEPDKSNRTALSRSIELDALIWPDVKALVKRQNVRLVNYGQAE
jgi:predicted glycoside hydrolase/deacetylase ChbG (UPF0249 family)